MFLLAFASHEWFRALVVGDVQTKIKQEAKNDRRSSQRYEQQQIVNYGIHVALLSSRIIRR
jgi:hypothetical protein